MRCRLIQWLKEKTCRPPSVALLSVILRPNSSMCLLTGSVRQFVFIGVIPFTVSHPPSPAVSQPIALVRQYNISISMWADNAMCRVCVCVVRETKDVTGGQRYLFQRPIYFLLL